MQVFFFLIFTQKKTLPGHIPGKVFYIIIVNPYVRPRMVGRCLDHLNSWPLGIQQLLLIGYLTTYCFVVAFSLF